MILYTSNGANTRFYLLYTTVTSTPPPHNSPLKYQYP